MNYPFVFDVIDLESEGPIVSDIESFSWQGEVFEKRPNQLNKISDKKRRKRSLPDLNDVILERRDDIVTGVFVIVENISTIDDFLVGSPRKPFHDPRRIYIITITNAGEPNFEKITIDVLTKLWKDYGIALVILLTPCQCAPEVKTYFYSN